MHPVILLIVLIAVLYFLSMVKRLPPAKQKQLRNRMLLFGVGGILLVGLLTGRLNPIFAALAAAVPLLHRLSAVGQLFKTFAGGQRHASSGQTSRVRTKFLHMTLEHDTGQMNGEIIAGDFAGKTLSELSLAQLTSLLERYRREDPQSAAVLEAYLDRNHSEEWAGAGERAQPNVTTADMTTGEACEVLGVSQGASQEEIVTAHRRLMQKLHPDRGGSTYLAAKINQAKEVLLGA